MCRCSQLSVLIHSNCRPTQANDGTGLVEEGRTAFAATKSLIPKLDKSLYPETGQDTMGSNRRLVASDEEKVTVEMDGGYNGEVAVHRRVSVDESGEALTLEESSTLEVGYAYIRPRSPPAPPLTLILCLIAPRFAHANRTLNLAPFSTRRPYVPMQHTTMRAMKSNRRKMLRTP